MTEKKIRISIKNKLFKILDDKANAKLLEKNIYNFTREQANEVGMDVTFDDDTFKMLYIQKSRSIIHNLNKNSYIKNGNLLKRINNMEYEETDFKLQDLPYIDHYQLFPERWDLYIQKQKILDKRLIDIPTASTTDQFKCSKCKQRKCTYVSVQIRSADEPMTNFITCLTDGCANAWRE